MEQGPKFTVQRKGERKPSEPLPLEAMLEQHAESMEVVDWLVRAPVGGTLITREPHVMLTRVQ